MSQKDIKVAELFAGIGGFRLGLEGYFSEDNPEWNIPSSGPYKTVWANQWEPPGTASKQFAWKCYEEHFGKGSCVNKDIHMVLSEYEEGNINIPDFDMLVGGFPCQDYSVAKPLKHAGGIEGKKGVLWWDIFKMLQLKNPKYILLENVDRLIKSPASQRGRDFAIMLSCLNGLGYSVEWRIINAADYGMPQRRRRIYLFGVKTEKSWDKEKILIDSGILSSAFPIKDDLQKRKEVVLYSDLFEISNNFGKGCKETIFQNSGVMQSGSVLTAKTEPKYLGSHSVLRDIVVADVEVESKFFISEDQKEKWEYCKGSKKEERIATSGYKYYYSEGPVAFPDSLDKPARTILTSEGGATANRSKHVICGDSGKLRRLIPDELDQTQMFPRGWTRGMSDNNRAYCIGNALVVGIPRKIGETLATKLASL